MPSTPWVPIVKTITNGTDTVSAEVVNPIFSSYTNRTQHLYEKIAELADKSVLIAENQKATDNVGMHNVVYYDPTDNTGLKKAKLATIYDSTIGQLRAANSSFVFGIVKDVADNLATVWLNGLITDTYLLSHLLDSDPANVGVEGGPLYLSSIQDGSLTFFPTGLAIYVGYALGPTTVNLNISFDPTNELFINYRFPLLDRPAGTPELNAGVWTIPMPDASKVGWLPVASENYSVGDLEYGAKFVYNIPSDRWIDLDEGLNATEKASAKLLRRVFPANTKGVNQLFVNGVLQLQREVGVCDGEETKPFDGIYRLDSTGLYWYTNASNKQPWAADLMTNESYPAWDTATWQNWQGSSSLRPRLTFVFSKLNPAYGAGLVTSLQPYYKAGINNSALSLQVVDNTDTASTSGDLKVRFNLVSDETLLDTATNAKAVQSLEYNQVTGKLLVTKAPRISAINAIGSIVASTDASTGICTLRSGEVAGPTLVTAIEPENARLEVTGLNTYLTFAQASLPAGMLGKITLPSSIPNLPLTLSFVVFGKASTTGNVGLTLQYSATAIGGVVSSALTTKDSTYTFPTGYVAYTTKVMADTYPSTNFTIPREAFTPGAVVNFRLQRKKTPNTYTADFCILAAYWSFA